MRAEILELMKLGPLPDSETAQAAQLDCFAALLLATPRPISDDEARVLVSLFGPDDCFGVAWTLIHAIETARGWPLWDCLRETSNPWIIELRERAERGGFQPPDGSESE